MAVGSRSAGQTAALIGAVLAVCGCCLVVIGLSGVGGVGSVSEGDALLLLQKMHQRATTGMEGAGDGGGDAVASKEIKEALKEVRATIASLEEKSRSVHTAANKQNSRTMLGGAAAERFQRGSQSCDDYHVTYDPPSQHFYYDVEVSGGGSMRWVRHWCPSEWRPQEAFYRYQRFMPRSQNNRPPPPINDFDFLDSYARSYYTKSRR